MLATKQSGAMKTMSEDTRLDEDETDMEDVAVVSAVAKVEAPEAVVEDEVVEEAVAETIEAPVAKPAEMFDEMLLKDLQSDPEKKELLEKAVNKVAQRLKDEWAGREGGWLPKAKRKEYVGNPDKWTQEQAKLAEYEKLKAEVAELRKNPVPKAPEPEAKAPEEDFKIMANEFVKENNMDEAQAPMVAALFTRMDRIRAAKENLSPVDLPKELAKLEWEKERLAAESDEDYKTNEVLRALSWAKARGGSTPAKALADSKMQLGIKRAKKIVGTPQKGTPAFARSSGNVPTEGIGYDGKTDPLDALIKELTKG